MKKRILLIGEHPYGNTGNSHMMKAVLDQIEPNQYDLAVFAGNFQAVNIPAFIFQDLPYTLITPVSADHDPWGKNIVLSMIALQRFDAVIFIGLDIWWYASIIGQLKEMCIRNGTILSAIFPYDLQSPREEWLRVIKCYDLPYAYSEYGVNALLNAGIDNINYFRPPLVGKDQLYPGTPEEKEACRKQFYPSSKKDAFVFGFIGKNQVRKDPQNLLKAFSILQKKHPNTLLYMHTDFHQGAFNLKEAARTYGIDTAKLVYKHPDVYISDNSRRMLYNSFDAYIMPSMQEGLSWTPYEAMLCGIPIIVSDTTAHQDIPSNCTCFIPCEEQAYLEMLFEYGSTSVDTMRCHTMDIVHSMENLIAMPEKRIQAAENALKYAREWVNGAGNINDVIEACFRKKEEYASKVNANMSRRKAILFVQHSAAGDVLMTTQCFKGIKENHPGLPLVYMTQKMFQGIVKNNPYVDEVIDWDENQIKKFEVVYNPHGEKILPGGWNNLDVKLADMYPYFCHVSASPMQINQTKPDIDLEPKSYIVVHTTGGQAEYRTYKHMDKVLKSFPNETFVQIGGVKDLRCDHAKYDLRGELDWEQSAWVMKNAKAAIVIDSFPSHLAGAMGTPAVVLYGPAPARVVGPIGHDKIINLQPDMLKVCGILNHCWGNPPVGKQKCMSPCINTISPLKVRDALKELLNAN